MNPYLLTSGSPEGLPPDRFLPFYEGRLNLLRKWIADALSGFRRWTVHWTSLALIIAAMACSFYSRNAESAKPGQKLQDCPECPEMVVVPPGSFRMGSPANEHGRDDDEGPVHKVTIDYMFAVGVYEVTFSEWDYCVEQGGCHGYHPYGDGWGRLDRPVIDISWEHAKAYVKWLSRETGKPYRLLTEAEWEYAARAGTATPFHFGNTISTDQANYDGRSVYGSGKKGKYRQRTIPVGSFPANKFGLHDVHGNVWEWVEDCWHDNYKGASTDGSAWIAGGNCSKRVFRGGSWFSGPRGLRSADRDWIFADSRDSSLGFRVALTLTP